MIKKTAIALSTLFLASCGDPNMPAQNLTVGTPEWAAGLGMDVRKRSCDITTESGQNFPIGYSETALDNGLTATRGKRYCTVYEPATDTWCTWYQYTQTPSSCQTTNPEYTAYQARLQAQKPQ